MLGVTGLSGMGVTSTLCEMADRLASQRWGTAVVSAGDVTPERTLRALLADAVDEALDSIEKRGLLERRLAHLRGVVHELRVGEGGLALDVLEAFRELGTAMARHQCGVMVMLDDAHHLGAERSLVAAVAGASAERGLPATILMGGLPAPLPQLELIELGPLGPEDITDVLTTSASELDVGFHTQAVERIAAFSRGVPFMVQAFAHHAWNASDESPILASAVDVGAGEAQGDLTAIWYAERVADIDATQRRYLIAVKELGSQQVPIDQVGRRIGNTVSLAGGTDSTGVLDSLVKLGLLCRRDETTVGFSLAAFDRFIDSQW